MIVHDLVIPARLPLSNVLINWKNFTPAFARRSETERKKKNKIELQNKTEERSQRNDQSERVNSNEKSKHSLCLVIQLIRTPNTNLLLLVLLSQQSIVGCLVMAIIIRWLRFVVIKIVSPSGFWGYNRQLVVAAPRAYRVARFHKIKFIRVTFPTEFTSLLFYGFLHSQ